MRLALPVLALFSFTACDTSKQFRLAENLSCDAGFLAWNNDLTYAVVQGDGDGSFSFDPPGRVEVEREGQYDLYDGDFIFDVRFDQAHWRTSSVVEGFGYVKQNGDLDIQGTSAFTDVLGEYWTLEFDSERTGCDEATAYRDPDGDDAANEWWIAGSYVRDAFEYEATYEGGEDWVITGTRRSDQTSTEYQSYDAGGTVADYVIDEDADGNSVSDWEEITPDYEAIGTTEVDIAGTAHYDYVLTADGTDYHWDYTVDYGGDGEGTVEIEGTTCDIWFDDWECTYDCGGGSEGSC